LDFLRAIVTRSGRFFLLTVGTFALKLLPAPAIVDEKLIRVRAISKYRLLEEQQGDHPGKEEER